MMSHLCTRLQQTGLQKSSFFKRTLSTGESYWKASILYPKGESCAMKPVESAIHEKLTDAFSPTHLEIINESYMHNVPQGSETHFKVVVVSEKFENLSLIKKHRLVNEALACELQNGVHALSIMAKTPAQWQAGSQQVPSSPACRGGFGK